MITSGKILYTDGHEVTVTDSAFQVKNTSYQLNGITKHGFLVLHPDRLPALLVLLLGAMLVTMGAFNLIPVKGMPILLIGNYEIGVNGMAIGLGAVFAVLGILIMGLLRERYAVRIATAEGEKNVVVSRSKAYVAQIVDALNRALRSVVPNQKKK